MLALGSAAQIYSQQPRSYSATSNLGHRRMEEPLIASTSGRHNVNVLRGLLTLDSSFGVPPFSRALNHAKTRKQLQMGLRATRQESRRKGESEGERRPEEREQSQSVFAGGLGNLVNTLLFGAASRIERGTSVCVSCKGTGTMICKECNATGVTNAPSCRDTSTSFKSLVGTKSKEKEWIVSNRCRNCRGHGRLECPNCNGLGKRYIAPAADW